MAGFALGQLGGGGLSDGRGRRPVLLGGLACFTLAGLACAVSLSGEVLALSRLIQGLGAGTCAVISFAMVQDLFEGDAARAKRSYVTAIFGAVPVLAPALGTILIDVAGWRSVHAVLAIAGAVLLAVAWAGVGESRLTRPDSGRSLLSSPTLLLWDDSRFVRFALANALSYGVIFAYIAGSPVVIMRELGLSSSVFAGVFACTAAALAFGAWSSGRLGRAGASATALVTPSLIVSAASTLVLACVSLAGLTAGLLLVPLLLVVLFTRGIIAPNLQHLAIERHPERAGAASAFVGVSQLTAGVLASAVVAFLMPIWGANAVAVPMALMAVAALAAWRWSLAGPADQTMI